MLFFNSWCLLNKNVLGLVAFIAVAMRMEYNTVGDALQRNTLVDTNLDDNCTAFEQRCSLWSSERLETFNVHN